MLSESLFISDTIHERDVTLSDGSVHKLYFKELPAIEFRRFARYEQSKDEDEQLGSMARLIAASLCEPDGKSALTYKQALNLKSSAANAIANVVLEINGVGEAGKVLPPEESDGSGTSSPLRLAAGQ